MKPAPFSYRRPSTLAEALTALQENSEAKVLAGGQSLVPLLSMRLAAPALLVDINALPDLDHVTCDDSGVWVGALARHARVQADVEARRVQPLLAQALRYVAHPTIRNRGTTVGSVVHADASGEIPAVLRLLDGTVSVQSAQGLRTITAEELFLGPLETSVRPDEIAVEAFFPALPEGAGCAFDEMARRNGDYALCGVAAVIGTDDEGSVSTVRTSYLSVGEVPTVVDLSDAPLSEAGEVAADRLDPAADIHATADYRRQLVRVLTGRVVRRAYQHAQERRGVRT